MTETDDLKEMADDLRRRFEESKPEISAEAAAANSGYFREMIRRYLQQQGSEVTDLISQGTACRGCGECCGRFLPLWPGEQETIIAYALSHRIRPHRPRGGKCAIDMMCPWLSDKGECMVYEVRPQVCRIFRCDKGPRGFTADDVIDAVKSNGGAVALHDMREDISHVLPGWQA